MIIEKIVNLYETDADLLKRRAPGKGNPTASSAGRCLAQQQMLRVPALTHPELRPIRTAWVFEDGDQHAENLRQKLRRVYPKLTGLSEELFYFPVPVTPDQASVLREKIVLGTLWGTAVSGFSPPHILIDPAGGKPRVRLAPRDPKNTARPRPMGFVLDQTTSTLWVPVYIDHAVHLPEWDRLMVVEYKSMSRWGFRRALLGEMGYAERMQLAMIGEATGMDTVWFIKAKDTAHLLEIAFLQGHEGTRVSIRRTNGQQDTFWVKDQQAVTDTGTPVDLHEDETWDVGAVWTPYAPALLDQARARILRVLLHEPPSTWAREAGPEFTCAVCRGTGTQTMRKDGSELLKKPKPCADCNETGRLEETELPSFPCGYCPVVHACYPFARLEVTDKPRYLVQRADYEASGITWTPPEPVERQSIPARPKNDNLESLLRASLASP